MSSNGDDLKSKLLVLLLGVGLAAMLITVYRCVILGSNRYRTVTLPPPSGQNDTTHMAETPSSAETSTAQLIPAYKYQKGKDLIGDEVGTCAICLCEFEEGEELRMLPECLHSYHVACIDMWLHSHTSCPICRNDAMPTPQSLEHIIEFDSQRRGSEMYRDVGMLQNVIVHSRTM
ncbi:hypothetical protein K2173_011861 [Erythroxylum novogranatense]|uniref:RING-type E3 ubiquitin transferase n=1 Tax=Erythroxylum novogranatense TaxID=1862640 RepID=A0AAV8T212_9ROSI|nr:hypothetical protein K2173_011861 [Erythroxylum novogranatense]